MPLTAFPPGVTVTVAASVNAGIGLKMVAVMVAIPPSSAMLADDGSVKVMVLSSAEMVTVWLRAANVTPSGRSPSRVSVAVSLTSGSASASTTKFTVAAVVPCGNVTVPGK